MTFLEVVNRIFRANGIIKGDDDAITTFADTAHNAAIQLAQIAVQDEINDLVADNVIAYEVTTGTLTTTASTRTYALAADFIRFAGKARFYRPAANRPIYEWPGGVDSLAEQIWTYDVDQGEPNWWYFEPTTTKRVGFYHVPNAAFIYTYRYEKNVTVSASSDDLPFHNDAEAQAFSQAAGRRFKALYEGLPDVIVFLVKDPVYNAARSTLFGLMKGRNPLTRYGALYR
jgi:hypothetical protein